MKLVVMMSAVALCGAPWVARACTQQEAMAKGAQASQLLQTRMRTDSNATAAVMERFEARQDSIARKMEAGRPDWNEACSYYDDLSKALK